MNSYELCKLVQLTDLLKEMTPVLARFLETEVPLIVAKENCNDLRHQLDLPLTYGQGSSEADSEPWMGS